MLCTSTWFCASLARAEAPSGNLSRVWSELEHFLFKTQVRARSGTAHDMAAEYLSATPFPHAVLDDWMPDSVVRAVNEENCEACRQQGLVDLTRLDRRHQRGKAYANDDLQFGPATRMVFSAFKSAAFIAFLERLTGIYGLIPDPHFSGSGLHRTSSGGSLKLHADFNGLPSLEQRWREEQQLYGKAARSDRFDRGLQTWDYQLARRVNVFLYLNYDWPESYGGHLELWDRNITKCGARVLPTAGRIVVFSTTDFSWHGHPHPLSCPKNRARLSLALYFYTNGRPERECLGNCTVAKSVTWLETPEDKCKANTSR
jgi:hypothetical protein